MREAQTFLNFFVFAWKNVKIVSKYMRLNFCQPIWLCCSLNTAIYWYLNSRSVKMTMYFVFYQSESESFFAITYQMFKVWMYKQHLE